MATLYDAYGRPVNPGDLIREKAAPTLAGVRTIWNESAAGGLTPVRLAAILRDAAQGDHTAYLTLAEEMEERDLHYACELSKRKLAVSRLPITVESYSDDQRDLDLADEVRALVRRSGFRTLIKDLLDAVGKGFSVCEIRWERSERRWTPKEYVWRDPRFFCFEQAGLSEIRLRDEANLSEGLPLAPFAFIVHKPHIKSGIPIRGGLARLAAWAWMCKGYTIKDWLAFAEVFGMPLRLGKYESGASEQDKDVLRLAVANLGTDAAAIFPKSMDIQLVEAAKQGGANFYQLLADYLDAQVSRGILGQTATTQGTPGKLGNEEAQKEVREDIRDDDAAQIEETINRDLVKSFIDLNWGPQENYPSVMIRAVKPENIAVMSAALKDLVPLGLTVIKSEVRDKLGFSDPDEDAPPEDLLGAPPSQPAAEPALNREVRGLNRAADDPADDPDDEGDEIDELAADELADWEPLMRPIMDPVAELIDEALARGESLADLRDRLVKLLEASDTGALVEALATAMLKARGLGDAGDEG